MHARNGSKRRNAYPIPAGGSSPLGNVGFVNAALELEEQISAGLLPAPDAIYIAMGSMGSAVGLAIGLAAVGLGLHTRVVAVRTGGAKPTSLKKMQ
eukprot:gene800-4739_t